MYTPETDRRLVAAEDELASGAPDDPATVSDERQAALLKLAGYCEHPETAPWDWDLLRDVRRHAWR